MPRESIMNPLEIKNTSPNGVFGNEFNIVKELEIWYESSDPHGIIHLGYGTMVFEPWRYPRGGDDDGDDGGVGDGDGVAVIDLVVAWLSAVVTGTVVVARGGVATRALRTFREQYSPRIKFKQIGGALGRALR
ncbi:hypothetical protein Tco_0585623 [Tanacetum coccineum]